MPACINPTVPVGTQEAGLARNGRMLRNVPCRRNFHGYSATVCRLLPGVGPTKRFGFLGPSAVAPLRVELLGRHVPPPAPLRHAASQDWSTPGRNSRRCTSDRVWSSGQRHRLTLDPGHDMLRRWITGGRQLGTQRPYRTGVLRPACESGKAFGYHFLCLCRPLCSPTLGCQGESHDDLQHRPGYFHCHCRYRISSGSCNKTVFFGSSSSQPISRLRFERVCRSASSLPVPRVLQSADGRSLLTDRLFRP